MKPDIVEEWLKAAESDLQVMNAICDNPDLTHMTAFHAQQAIEKILKASLELQNKMIPKYHKLSTLLQLSEMECELDSEMANRLDELYIDARYPGELGLLPYGRPTLEDAKSFMKSAQKLYQWMRDIHSKQNEEKR